MKNNPDKYGNNIRAVVALVNTRDTTTPQDVAIQLNMKPNNASTYLQRARTHGLISKTKRGVFAPLPNPEPTHTTQPMKENHT